MKFPISIELNCPPFGLRAVIFDIMNEDEDFLVSDELGTLAVDQITSQWIEVWSQALPMLDELLIAYRQDETVAMLLADYGNTLNVIIMLPEEDDNDSVRFRFEVFIDRKTGRGGGSIVFGVEFVDLKAESASATF